MSQLMLTWLSLCPADEKNSKWKKCCYILFTVTMFLIELIGFICSLAYLLTYVRKDLEKALYSVFQIAATSGVIYAMTAVFFLRHKMSDIFTNLSKIYKASENRFKYCIIQVDIEMFVQFIFHEISFEYIDENDDSFQFLARANSKCEWIWKMYIKLVLFGFPSTTFLAAAASVAICWLAKGNFDAKYLFYPLKLM